MSEKTQTRHCAGCHITFGSLAAFDHHLSYPNGRDAGPPEHADPCEDAWFAQNTRGHWCGAKAPATARATRPAAA